MDTLTGTPWTARATGVVLPRRRRDVIVDEMDGEIVFSDPENGATYHLNETARIVWEACDAETTTREVATEITARYDVPFDDALDDVEQVVVMLAESGLLVLGGAA